MKKLFMILTSIILIQNTGFADPIDTVYYTVIAPSGLSLRNDYGLEDTKKIDIIPFGTKITIKGDYNEIYDEDMMETIDGRPGYWFKTKYNGKEGYVFSGYLKYGDLYLPSTEINKDYRVIFPGERCDAINYDPELNWYGLIYDTENRISKLQPIEVNFDYSYDSMDMDMSYAGIGDFVNVGNTQKKNFLLYIGTRNPINVDHIDFEKSYFSEPNASGYVNWGRFVYPYERLEIAKVNNFPYYLTGHEIARSEENSVQVNRHYKLYLSTNNYGIELTRKDTVDVTRELHDYDFHAYHLPYRGIKVLWQGDLNADGFPDLIFHTPYNSEGCGGSIFFHLMLSEKKGDKFILKKAAEDIIESCHGC